MSARAEQLVLEYLSRVADEAHGMLRSDERLRFVTRVRGAIDRRRQAAGAWEPAAVRRVLAELGDPQALVRRERGRLDELAASTGVAGPAEPADAAGRGNGATPGPAPGAVNAANATHALHAAIATDTANGGTTAGRGSVGDGATAASILNAAAAPTRPPEPDAAQARGVAGAAKENAAPGSGARPAAVAAVRWRTRPVARTPRAASAPASQWRRSHPPLPRAASPAASRSRPRTRQQTTSGLARLARTYGREAAALALLGPGGVLLPIPLWVIGALIALTSWAWTGLERFIGLGGPLIVTAAGIGVIGLLNKNPSMPIDVHAYIGAAQAEGQLLLRIGAAAGALFLGARLFRRYRASVKRSASR